MRIQESAYIARCVLGPWRCLSNVGVVDVSVEHAGLLAAVAVVATLPSLLAVVVGLAEAILADQDTSAILGAFVGLLVLDMNIRIDVTLLGCTGRALSTSLIRDAFDQAILNGSASGVDGTGEDPLIFSAGIPVATRLMIIPW